MIGLVTAEEQLQVKQDLEPTKRPGHKEHGMEYNVTIPDQSNRTNKIGSTQQGLDAIPPLPLNKDLPSGLKPRLAKWKELNQPPLVALECLTIVST